MHDAPQSLGPREVHKTNLVYAKESTTMVRVPRAGKQSSNPQVMATMMTVEKGHGLDLLGYCALRQQTPNLRQSQGGIDSFDQNGPIVAPSQPPPGSFVHL